MGANPRGRWDRNRQKQHLAYQAERDAEVRAMKDLELGKLARQRDLAMLHDLLNHEALGKIRAAQPERAEYWEARILRSIEWLKQNPTKSLYQSFREGFLTQCRLFNGIARGNIANEPGMPAGTRAKANGGNGQRATALKIAQWRERKAKFEASYQPWEKDPSLLPKKPPSAPRLPDAE